MILLGITGGIGMGKSTAGQILEQRGIPVVDTDLLARAETERGSPCLLLIREEFGDSVFEPDGALNRAALGRRVFADGDARARLEAILHPRIARAWRSRVEEWRSAGVCVGAVLIPLLFERGYQQDFTACVAVACTAGTQRERLLQRKWDSAEIEARNRAQLPVDEKMARSRFVVWTEGRLEVHARQWGRLLETLTPASPN